jgi:hypothetical protein
MLLAVSAAPAQADWLSLPGLSAPGSSWVREYTTSPTQPATIYASTEGSGVWRSTDNGLSWKDFSDGLKTVPGAMNVRTVYISGTTAYAGTTAGLQVGRGRRLAAGRPGPGGEPEAAQEAQQGGADDLLPARRQDARGRSQRRGLLEP